MLFHLNLGKEHRYRLVLNESTIWALGLFEAFTQKYANANNDFVSRPGFASVPNSELLKRILVCISLYIYDDGTELSSAGLNIDQLQNLIKQLATNEVFYLDPETLNVSLPSAESAASEEFMNGPLGFFVFDYAYEGSHETYQPYLNAGNESRAKVYKRYAGTPVPQTTINGMNFPILLNSVEYFKYLTFENGELRVTYSATALSESTKDDFIAAIAGYYNLSILTAAQQITLAHSLSLIDLNQLTSLSASISANAETLSVDSSQLVNSLATIATRLNELNTELHQIDTAASALDSSISDISNSTEQFSSDSQTLATKIDNLRQLTATSYGQWIQLANQVASDRLTVDAQVIASADAVRDAIQSINSVAILDAASAVEESVSGVSSEMTNLAALTISLNNLLQEIKDKTITASNIVNGSQVFWNLVDALKPIPKNEAPIRIRSI